VRRPTFTQIRAAALFAGGLLGVAYVTVIDNTDRPTLLILFGAMLGLPLFLKNDASHVPPTPQVPPSQPPATPPPAPPPANTGGP
jgi:hypothetical protein